MLVHFLTLYPSSTWIVGSQHILFNVISVGVTHVPQGFALRLGILGQLVFVDVFVNLGRAKDQTDDKVPDYFPEYLT